MTTQARFTLRADEVRPGDWLVRDDGTETLIRALDNSNPLLVTFNWGADAVIRARRAEVTVLREVEDAATVELDNAGATYTTSLGQIGIRLVAADPASRRALSGLVLGALLIGFAVGVGVGGLLAWWLL